MMNLKNISSFLSHVCSHSEKKNSRGFLVWTHSCLVLFLLKATYCLKRIPSTPKENKYCFSQFCFLMG